MAARLGKVVFDLYKQPEFAYIGENPLRFLMVLLTFSSHNTLQK